MYGEPTPDAPLRDRLAWSLSEFVDDGAPMNIGRFRLAAGHVIEKFKLTEAQPTHVVVEREILRKLVHGRGRDFVAAIDELEVLVDGDQS